MNSSGLPGCSLGKVLALGNAVPFQLGGITGGPQPGGGDGAVCALTAPQLPAQKSADAKTIQKVRLHSLKITTLPSDSANAFLAIMKINLLFYNY